MYMKRYFKGLLAAAAVTCLTAPSWALEAVVQSDVGSSSAVAGSIGAVQAQVDALKANQAASNGLIQQLQSQVNQLIQVVQQLTSVTINGGNNDSKSKDTDPIYRIQCYSDINRAQLFTVAKQPDGRYIGSARPGMSAWVVELDKSGNVLNKLNCWDWEGGKAYWEANAKSVWTGSFKDNALCKQYGMLEERKYGLGVYLASCTPAQRIN